MENQKVTVSEQDDKLVVSGVGFEAGGGAKWEARLLDERHVLLVTGAAPPSALKNPDDFGCTASARFKDYLLSLHRAGFSGAVAVDTGFGLKKIFFESGAIVFAGSNIMDDRLGEVIFREAKISLDELTDSAAQVTKSRKFGQVLISSGIFTNTQLWEALKLQVRQILRSMFMSEQLCYDLQVGHGMAPTQVVFAETMTELIGESYSFGSAFRAFLAKLRAESEVVLTAPSEVLEQEHSSGTFIGDLLGLISQEAHVQSLLNASKLIDPYTVAALLQLVNLGHCRIQPEVEEPRKTVSYLAPLKSKIDAYTYILQVIRKAFDQAGKALPINDLQDFVAGLNPGGFASLSIDSHGVPSRDCLSGILSQCMANADRVAYFTLRFESLIQFILQVSGDNLEYKVAQDIRQDFRAVSQ